MPLPDRLTRPVRIVRRAVLSRRRLIAALLLGVGVAAGLRVVAAPPPPSVTVVTAARDLPAGAVLAADDLVARPWPAEVAPPAAVDDPVGLTLAAPVGAGEPVTEARLVGPALVAADPSRVAVPVRLPDAGAVALLEPGDRIDLLATDPRAGGAATIATDVPVLAVPPADEQGVSAQPGALVVVAAEPQDVRALADAGVRLFLSYVFSR